MKALRASLHPGILVTQPGETLFLRKEKWSSSEQQTVIKRPLRDACLCMGELQAPPAPHFVFLITL